MSNFFSPLAAYQSLGYHTIQMVGFVDFSQIQGGISNQTSGIKEEQMVSIADFDRLIKQYQVQMNGTLKFLTANIAIIEALLESLACQRGQKNVKLTGLLIRKVESIKLAISTLQSDTLWGLTLALQRDQDLTLIKLLEFTNKAKQFFYVNSIKKWAIKFSESYINSFLTAINFYLTLKIIDSNIKNIKLGIQQNFFNLNDVNRIISITSEFIEQRLYTHNTDLQGYICSFLSASLIESPNLHSMRSYSVKVGNNLQSQVFFLQLLIQIIAKSDFNILNLSSQEWQGQANTMVHKLKLNSASQNIFFLILSITRYQENLVRAGSNSAYILKRLQFNFTDKNLEGIRLRDTDLSGAVFLRTNLRNSVFTNVNVTSIDLQQADLTGANWSVIQSNQVSSLTLHSNSVFCIDISSCGRLLASGSADKQIKIWKIHRQRMHRTINVDAAVHSVKFLPNGYLISSFNRDSSVRLWNLLNGALIRILRVPTIGDMDFAHDSKFLVFVDDNFVSVFNHNLGVRLAQFQNAEIIEVVALSNNQMLLATSTDKNQLALRCMNKNELLGNFAGHKKKITCITFSPSDDQIASGSQDCSIIIWSTTQQLPITRICGHYNQINDISFSWDGRVIASCGDHSACVWTLEGKEVNRFYEIQDYISQVKFTKDGKFLVTSNLDNTIRMWDCTNSVQESERENVSHKNYINALAMSPDERVLVSASGDWTIKFWSMETGEYIQTLIGHEYWVLSLAFSPDGSLLASSSADTSVRLWKAPQYSQLKQLQGHQSEVWRVRFSNNGKYLASAGWDGIIFLWKPHSGEQILKLNNQFLYLQDLCFSPYDDILISGSDESIKIWSLSSGQMKTEIGLFCKIFALAICKDGKKFISGNSLGQIQVWNTHNGKPISQMFVPTGSVSAIQILESSNLIAGGWSGHLCILDYNRKQVVTLIAAHEYRVKSIVFSPKNSVLVSTGDDITIKMWSVQDQARKPDPTLIRTLKGNRLIALGINITQAQIVSNHNFDLSNVLNDKITLEESNEYYY